MGRICRHALVESAREAQCDVGRHVEGHPGGHGRDRRRRLGAGGHPGARGPAFTVGIDVKLLASLQPGDGSRAESSMHLYRTIRELQRTASCFAESPKPVIAAVHGYCLGRRHGPDHRLRHQVAAMDAIFSIRETRRGWLPMSGPCSACRPSSGRVSRPSSPTQERTSTPGEAFAIGLVNEVLPTVGATLEAAGETAQQIAENSPLVIRGIQEGPRRERGRSVEQALDNAAQWNAAFLISNDLTEAVPPSPRSGSPTSPAPDRNPAAAIPEAPVTTTTWSASRMPAFVAGLLVPFFGTKDPRAVFHKRRG